MINKVLKENLLWFPIATSIRDFECDKYSKEICYLRMNNFPEEPLWTLFYKGESFDFDDAPASWKINYRNN